MAKDSQMGPKGVRMKKCNYQTPLTSEEAKNSNRTHKKNTPYLQKFSKTLVVITNFCIILFLQKIRSWQGITPFTYTSNAKRCYKLQHLFYDLLI